MDQRQIFDLLDIYLVSSLFLLLKIYLFLNVIFDKGHVVVEKLDSDPEEYAKYTDYI